MNVSPTEIRPENPKRARFRLIVLILLGAIAVGISFGVRRSDWARERQLRNLSVEQLALAIHDDPNDALTFVYYGSALLRAGDLPDAENAFQRAVQLAPRMTQAQLGLASTLLREGKLKTAKEAFEATLRLDPKEAGAYMGLSQVYYQAGSPKSAIDPLKKLIELHPDNALAWYHLGKLYGEDHQPALALESLKKAAALEPKQADIWRDLGQVTAYYTRNAEAEQAYTKALALTPNDPATHFLLGQLYMAQNDTPALRSQAEQEFQTTLKFDPKMQKAYFALGQVYERAGAWSKAVTYYRKAQELDLSDYQALYHLGFCLVKTGQKAEGKKLIAASQELGAARREMEGLANRILTDPQNRDLHLQLARSYRKYGNDEGALTQYTIYQRMGASDPAVAKEIADFQAAHPQAPAPDSNTPATSGGSQ
jgi:cytochrome c-type biogenesis protein CcmH/NrfG